MNLYKSTNLKRATNCRFSTAGRPASPLATTEAPAAASPTADGGLPAPVKVLLFILLLLLLLHTITTITPVKAAPGPNGEEYYYYYYYYDDEEGEKNVSALDIKLHLYQKQM